MHTKLIKHLSAHSDKYGHPHLLGCLEFHGKSGYFEVTTQEIIEYIRFAELEEYDERNKHND